MAFEFIEGLATLYIWTWYLWPFVFVSSFAKGLSILIKNGESSTYNKSLIIAGFSLLVIIAGITPWI